MRTVFAVIKVLVPLAICIFPLTIYATDLFISNGISISEVISKGYLLEIAQTTLKIIKIDVSIKL